MLTGLYAVAIALGSFLLFSIQPMFTKMALPLLGGSPAVWSTAQVFFQATLFAGYLYAHLLSKHLAIKTQVLVHSAFLIATLLVLPIAINPAAQPPVLESPINWFIGLLAVSLGLPFLLVSTTAPLLQRWFALTTEHGAGDPYFLYAASNFGGLLALLSYPFLLAPVFGLMQQSSGWTLGYGLWVVLVVACGVTIFGKPTRHPFKHSQVHNSDPEITWRQRLGWFSYAFVPSSLLLGVTQHISTDIAASPLLWIAPLTLFLLTFILTFSARVIVAHSAMLVIQPALLILVSVFFFTENLIVSLVLHLSTFFVTAMVCHGALARSRPQPQSLTEFYLYMSLGGVAGGLFVGFVAPQVFSSIAEYPLALVLACLLRPELTNNNPRGLLKDILLAAVVGFGHWKFATSLAADVSLAWGITVIMVVFALVFLSQHRPLRLALITLVIIAPTQLVTSNISAQHRSFFGVHRVLGDASGQYQLLTHGTTVHGAQARLRDRWREPLTYYYVGGPVGQFLDTSKTYSHVGIIGLGAGSMACYFDPTSTQVEFFEIDPVVVNIAANPSHFQFLSQCGQNTSVTIADGRRALALRTRDDLFDLLVLDAFSSDSIPVHLLTREAMQLYFANLTQAGTLLIHISNRQMNLEPVVKNLVTDANLVARVQHHSPTETTAAFHWKSSWVVVARDAESLKRSALSSAWVKLSGDHDRPWTDDYSNVMGAVKWKNVIEQ